MPKHRRPVKGYVVERYLGSLMSTRQTLYSMRRYLTTRQDKENKYRNLTSHLDRLIISTTDAIEVLRNSNKGEH